MKKTLKNILTTTALATTMLCQSCLYRAHIVKPELFNDIKAGKYGYKNRMLMYAIELEREGYDVAFLYQRGWHPGNQHIKRTKLGVKDKGGVWMEYDWQKGTADYGSPWWETYRVGDIRLMNGKPVQIMLVKEKGWRNKWVEDERNQS